MSAQDRGEHSDWKRGDACRLDSSEDGFFLGYTENGGAAVRVGRETVRLTAAELATVTKLGDATDLHDDADDDAHIDGLTNLEYLERIDALDALGGAIRQRRRRDDREPFMPLLRRAQQPECEWDRRHAADLMALALEPGKVSLWFRIRERVHRQLCTRSRA